MIKEIVRLVWIDSAGIDGDVTQVEAMQVKPIEVTTYGVLLSKDDTRVLIASTEDEGGYRGVLAVPIVNVLQIRGLRDG